MPLGAAAVPPGLLRGAAPPRQLAQGAGPLRTRRRPPTSPSSTTRAARRRAPRPRWPRRASATASPANRAPPTNRPPGPGRLPPDGRLPRPRASARPFGAGNLAAVLATCPPATPDRPRPRVHPRRARARPDRRPGREPSRRATMEAPPLPRTNRHEQQPDTLSPRNGRPDGRERGPATGSGSRFRNARAVDEQLSMSDATSRLIRRVPPAGRHERDRVDERRRPPGRAALRPPEDAGGIPEYWIGAGDCRRALRALQRTDRRRASCFP